MTQSQRRTGKESSHSRAEVRPIARAAAGWKRGGGVIVAHPMGDPSTVDRCSRRMGIRRPWVRVAAQARGGGTG